MSSSPLSSSASSSSSSSFRRGLLFGVLAYGLWGIVPLYWQLMITVDPVELIAHRAVWGLVAFVALVIAAGQTPALAAALRDRRTVGLMAISGGFVAINWGTFVYAVASHQLLEASLGYFINPLLSVALGTIVLRERLRRLQWLAIGAATAGVAVIAIGAGRAPWIALVLASSFAIYGLIRKTARVESLIGSTIETLLLAPIAGAYLGYLALTGRGAFGHAPTTIELYLLSTGAVTAIPLLLFTSAARRLPLSTVGFLQYLAPTGQFLLAVTVLGEPIARDKLTAFALIWIGLVVFSLDLARSQRSRAAAARG
jgi:chloramphenicol-sensitive protein RarD